MHKSKQLQIRVSPTEKALIEAQAKKAGMDVSKWILTQIVHSTAEDFQKLLSRLARASDPSFILSELNDFLTRLNKKELQMAIRQGPGESFEQFLGCYVAAMVELACTRHKVAIPAWALKTKPLKIPFFGSELLSLRLHLLTNSPGPFRKRNIFIDSSLGARI